MEHAQVIYERRGAAAVITLSRPDRLNTFTPCVVAEAVDASTAPTPVTMFAV